MRFLTKLEGVACQDGPPILCRDENNRLRLFGASIDVFDLLHWLDSHPLTQFREISHGNAQHYQPEISDQFSHLFDEKGNVK